MYLCAQSATCTALPCERNAEGSESVSPRPFARCHKSDSTELCGRSAWRKCRRASPPTRCRAKRVSKEEAAAGEWAALLDDSQEPESNGMTVEAFNELCNRGLKLMLSDNARELQDFREELNRVGSSFSEQENLDGALFTYVLYMLSEHTIVDQVDKLTGIYQEAFTRLYSILEDSGWKLKREGEEDEEDANTFDDLPNLGYIQQL